jgi:Mg-chelatase subunit ChlD
MNTSLSKAGGRIVGGSIADVAQRTGRSIAQAFLSVDAVILVDTSGSMAACDSRGGQSRYDVACEELARIQEQMPGRVAILSFSGDTLLCPAGVPTFQGGGTNLAGALDFAKQADVPGVRFIVISDGEPDSESAALQAARTIQAPISTIYVGPEGGYGQDFLRRLAAANGGQSVTADRAKELAAKVETLLLTAA